MDGKKWAEGGGIHDVLGGLSIARKPHRKGMIALA